MSLPKHHATRVGQPPRERFICAECLFPWPCEDAQRQAERAARVRNEQVNPRLPSKTERAA